jgi:hypothetical protein
MKIFLLTALTGLAAISCAGKAGGLAAVDGGAGGSTVIACSSDGQCGSSRSCFAKRCVDRIDNLGSWAVELSPPPPTDPNARGPAVTELLSVNGPPVVLSASASLSLVVPFIIDSISATTVPTTASVILTVPSRIPGRPDLSFQAQFTLENYSATVTVPDTVLGQLAIVNLIPLTPADLRTPPYTFHDVQIASSGPTIDPLMLPAASFKISGQLVNALDAGKGNFTARAFQGGLLASTTATTAPADGGFTIFLPMGTGPVNLELLPASGASDPWMLLAQLQLSATPKDLGPIALPPYLMANPRRVTVHGDMPGLPPVAGAAVRAIATIPGGDPRGSTRYLRDESTDAAGSTQLTLIPGDSQTALMYTFSVAPPAGSPWATQCLDGVSVLWNGSATPTIQDFSLPLRPVVSGTLLSVDGAPVADAVVTATRGMSAATSCLPGPATTSVITDATGAFKLALDAGDGYQLDYDPPAGSAAPRLTEYDVKVDGDATRMIRLPPAALFEGDVEDALQQPLPFTTIRIFEPRCPLAGPCLPPTLIGQIQSDAAGHFRVIVRAPALPN